MPRTRKPIPCSSCDTVTATPRRGLCNACYLRQRRGVLGEQCEICDCYDVRVLRAVKLGDGETHTGCHNHAWLAERTRPRPLDLDQWLLACQVPGDRRRPDGDRRSNKRRAPRARDRRARSAYIEPEKRENDRRAG